MSGIPRQVEAAPGQRLPVVQKSLGGKLGYFDTGTGEIAIEEDQPEIGKHIILLHEMIHLAAEKMKQAGLAKRQPPEEYVTNLAGTLFGMLALSGIWSGVEPDDVTEFYSAFEPEERSEVG